jgi:hypothetical protein
MILLISCLARCFCAALPNLASSLESLVAAAAFFVCTAKKTIAALFLVPAVYAILDDLGWLGALDQEADESGTLPAQATGGGGEGT